VSGVKYPFGPSFLLLVPHLRDLMYPAQGKILPLSWIKSFVERWYYHCHPGHDPGFRYLTYL